MTYKTQGKFGHNAMLVADLGLRVKEGKAGLPIFGKIPFELFFKFHHLALEYHGRLSQIR